MFRLTALAFASLMLGAALFVAGCKSEKDETPPQTTLTTTADGVMCTKCQAVSVQTPRTEKGRVVEYSSSKQMVCPDCKDAAANFFATGKLQQTCKTSGNSMEICQSH